MCTITEIDCLFYILFYSLFLKIKVMIVTIDELATLVAFCDLQKEPVLCQNGILLCRLPCKQCRTK